MVVDPQPPVDRVLFEEKAWSKTIRVLGETWSPVQGCVLHAVGELSVIRDSKEPEGRREIQESGIRLESSWRYGPFARAIAVRFPYASDRGSGD